MSPSPTDRFRRVDAVFDAVLDLPPDEQMAYLDRTLGDDPELRGEVSRLLQAYHRSDDFLLSPAAELAGPLFDAGELLGSAPERIGPWRIVRAIGRGGMGDVFLGERADGQFDQRAAIKVIRHETPGLIRRFLEERRILALLEHPGIARLIEGGIAPGGLPYFAMELVDGVPIDRYCADRDLSVDQRLALVAEVCDAVSYAHQRLVIHRDLKPSNILVTPDGRVRLLDFGIAKLLADGPASDRTETRFPAMTPEFAAPEQIRGDPVSTATDVYALGVLLYLLLTGQHPYEMRGKPLAELVRIVSEEVPQKPSARAPEPRRRRLRGDLDLVALTALHKEPERRYASPAALAGDLRRLRDGHPILARPDTAAYRIGKFVGRHRAGVAAAATLVLLLAAGAARERVLRHRAETEARKATEVGDYLVSVFDLADPFAATRQNGNDVTARALLERSTGRIDSTLAGQPEVQAELRSVFGRVYTNLGLFDQATSLLRESLAQRRALHGEPSLEVAADMDRLGDALVQQDRYEEAESLLRGALAQRRQLLGSAHDGTAESLDHLATLYQRRSDYAAAEPLFREALSIRRGLFGDTAMVVAVSLNNLALLLFLKDAYDEAERAYREALAIYLRLEGEDHPWTTQTLHNLAQTQDRRGRHAEAETLFRRALAAKRRSLGDAHPSITVNLNNLGSLLIGRGRVDEGEALIREALALDRRIFGERHSYVAAGLGNLGAVLRMKGQFAEAERHYRESLAIHRALFGSEHRLIASDLNSLGILRRLQGDLPGAVQHLQEAAGISRRLLGEHHLSTLAPTINLGRALESKGSAAEAEALLRGAASRLDTANGGHRPWYVNAQTGVGLALLAEGRAEEARELLERTLRMARRELGDDDVRTADAQLALGRTLLFRREYVEAKPMLEAAFGVFEKHRKAQPYLAAQASAALTELRRHRGN